MTTKAPATPDRLDGYTPSTDPPDNSAFLAAAKAERDRVSADARMDDASRMDEVQRWDGFINELTGLGTIGQDKTLGGKINGPDFQVQLLSGWECEQRWRGSDLGGRIVETIPDEMTREGWNTLIQPDEGAMEDPAAGGQQRSRSDGLDSFRLAWRACSMAHQARRHGQRAYAARLDAFAAQLVAKAKAEGQEEPPRPQPIPEQDDSGVELAEQLQQEEDQLGLVEACWKALCYVRAYGGGGIFMGIDDGQKDLALPLDETRIRRVKHLTAFRGGWDGELIAWRYYNNMTEARYGTPAVYMLRNLGVPVASSPAPGEKPSLAMPSGIGTNGLITYVHESRLLVFPGIATSHWSRVQMRGWGDSVYTRVNEVLGQFGQTWQAVANLMTEWSLGTLKIEGLAKLFAANDPSKSNGLVMRRMLAWNLSKSVAKTGLMDSTEEFKRDIAPLTGVAEVLQQFIYRMAAAADMPVELLFGQAASGLNKGDSTVRFFYDRVKARMLKQLMPQVQRFRRLQMLAKEGPAAGRVPKKWSITPRPLWQPTEQEAALVRKTQAEVDQIYITTQVLDAREVAGSRFGGAEYSTETVLDVDGREEWAANEQADREARAQKTQSDLDAAQKAAEEAAKNGLPAPPAPGAGTSPESAATALNITPSAQGAIVKVNQGLAKLGLPPLTTATGEPDPDGNLTIAEFGAKRAALIAKAAAAESGVDPTKPAPAPAGGSGFPPKGGAGGPPPPGTK